MSTIAPPRGAASAPLRLFRRAVVARQRAPSTAARVDRRRRGGTTRDARPRRAIDIRWSSLAGERRRNARRRAARRRPPRERGRAARPPRLRPRAPARARELGPRRDGRATQRRAVARSPVGGAHELRRRATRPQRGRPTRPTPRLAGAAPAASSGAEARRLPSGTAASAAVATRAPARSPCEASSRGRAAAPFGPSCARGAAWRARS